MGVLNDLTPEKMTTIVRSFAPPPGDARWMEYRAGRRLRPRWAIVQVLALATAGVTTVAAVTVALRTHNLAPHSVTTPAIAYQSASPTPRGSVPVVVPPVNTPVASPHGNVTPSSTPHATPLASPSPSASTPPPSANILQNGDFSSGTSHWGGWQATISTATVSGSPAGVCAWNAAGGSPSTWYSINYGKAVSSSVAGQTYTGSVQVRADSASSVGKPIVYVIRESTQSYSIVHEVQSAASVTLTNAWQTLNVPTYTVMHSGDIIDVYVLQSNGVSGDAFYVDHATLIAG